MAAAPPQRTKERVAGFRGSVGRRLRFGHGSGFRLRLRVRDGVHDFHGAGGFGSGHAGVRFGLGFDPHYVRVGLGFDPDGVGLGFFDRVRRRRRSIGNGVRFGHGFGHGVRYRFGGVGHGFHDGFRLR